jgi:pimeloyl-ACP methyl ester carboxylesterase
MSVDGVAIFEQALSLGPHRLVGMLSEPAAPAADCLTVVFLNSGSEPHIGSGRVWVEFSRHLAAQGYRCLRADFRGWGESPDDGFAPGRPYDQHGLDDSIAIVRALRSRGHRRVALLGLCAGAWIALRVALHEPLDGVIALNPQMYWQPGDPVEALMSETRARRTPERLREERGRRYGLWSALDIAGHRPWAGRWLDGLSKAEVPVAMVFAEGDDGIEYLRNRVARRLDRVRRSGIIRVVEVPEIDHSMHRVWLRPRMLETIRAQLDACAASADQANAAAPIRPAPVA